MTDPALGRDAPKRARWWTASAVLLVLSAGFLVAGSAAYPDLVPLPRWTAGPSAGGPAAGAVDPPVAAEPPAGAAAAAPRGADPVSSDSAPVELRIPAIGLAVSVLGVGLNVDRTVEVPTEFQRPGWFDLGPTPGERGSAVILGHVDSYRGPAVFYRLRSLRAGDLVEVRLADGTVTRFVVETVETYPKARFPAEQVYASRGYPALQLVTCGGEFDTGTRSYLSNVVAYTRLVGSTPPRDAG